MCDEDGNGVQKGGERAGCRSGNASNTANDTGMSIDFSQNTSPIALTQDLLQTELSQLPERSSSCIPDIYSEKTKYARAGTSVEVSSPG